MSKPNIVYILADDMGYGDVSKLNENSKIHTPNLDKLCEEGISFSDAHSTSAVCTPSRYGILTGRYNWRSRLKYGVLQGFSQSLIEKETKTFPSMLKDLGYKTACIGKWHLGLDCAKVDPSKEPKLNIDYTKKIADGPLNHGFDYFYGIPASLDMPPYVYIENDRFTEIPTLTTGNGTGKDVAFWREGPTAPGFKHEEVLDTLCDKVIKKIDEYKNDSFCIYFPLTAPHTPIVPTDKFKGKSNAAAYGDFVLQCDDIVGKVSKHLDDLNLSDNTILVFAADNGCSRMAHTDELEALGHFSSYKYRGYKAEIYEGGHRIPYIIKWKNTIKPNQTCSELVCLSDFMATIADLLGYKLADNMAVDSFSNLPLWNGKDVKIRDSVVHQSCDGSLALRKGPYKLEMCIGCGGWPNVKLLDRTDGPAYQLYNLDDDISESRNIIEQNPEIFESMKKELLDCVFNGRTTPGPKQNNNGENHWQNAEFLDEYKAK